MSNAAEDNEPPFAFHYEVRLSRCTPKSEVRTKFTLTYTGFRQIEVYDLSYLFWHALIVNICFCCFCYT
jgi:hypothetical protein